jgi:tetratricopeptide (TPR) repeat protein
MKRLLFACLLLLAATGAQAQLNKPYFFWMGRALLQEDRYEAAIETLNLLLLSDADLHEAYFLRGVAKHNLGDLLGAEDDFTKAIERNQVYTEAYNHRAITRAMIGNYDDALRDFGVTIELRPDFAGPYYNRAITLARNGQWEEALDDLNHFIRREERLVGAFLRRGEVYLNLRDTVRARGEFDEAIRTNRNSPEGYYYRGMLDAMQGRTDDALADMDRALERDSSYLPAYFSRAIIYDQTDRPMDALRDLDKVIELDDSHMTAFFNRAIIRSSTGRYDDALDDYNIVAAQNPNNVLVYFNRAGLYARRGDLTAAAADYTRAIELYPDFSTAYLMRSELRAQMRDVAGSDADRRTAERKIAEYRTQVADSTYSIYADPTRNFSQLLAFDTPFARGETDRRIERENVAVAIMPMFRFVHGAEPRTGVRERLLAEFLDNVDRHIYFTAAESDLPPDELVAVDGRDSDFEQGVAETMSKQYTNAVNHFSSAIERDPSNGFLYLSRSATRAEMIDFISSIENSYQRVSLDNDPASRLKSNAARTYSYDDAFSDVNKAIRLLPEFAPAWYNRGNLNVISGRMPDAYDDYTRAIELSPSFAEAYFNRGLVQIYMKDTRKGLLDLSKAGELGIDDAYKLLKTYSVTE